MESKKEHIIPIAIALLALLAFCVETKLFSIPFVLFGTVAFFLYPLRKSYPQVKRVMLFATLMFSLWLFQDLGLVILPFILSFAIAYLIDPLVTRFSHRKLKRWFVSLLFVLFLFGGLSILSALFFPSLFSQLREVAERVGRLVSQATDYFNSESFRGQLQSFGIPADWFKSNIEDQLVPPLESISKFMFDIVLKAVSSFSLVVGQVANAVLLPILTFYFLKDMPRVKSLITNLLERRDSKLLYDLRRINGIVREYISGQIITASFVGISASIVFTVFGIPYGGVIGLLCGLFNPIPYVGIFASMLVGIIVVLLTGTGSLAFFVLTIVITVLVLHFINVYFIEPRIIGQRVGLHPVMLITSLFVFSHFFGFIGLLLAVPTTAVLMMYFNDWRAKLEPKA